MPEDKLTTALTQFMLIDALSSIYLSLHIIDLNKNTSVEYNASSDIRETANKNTDADEVMVATMKNVVIAEHQEAALRFSDLHTVAYRLKGKRTITAEFIGTHTGWFRARFITIDTDENGLPTRVIFATEIIDEEKRREENLIRISLTDELTTLLNRRAYEEEMKLYADLSKYNDFVYISMDLNGLKRVNDNIGHSAGDELIVDAARIIRSSFANYGKIFRTGGDEFQAIIFANEEEVERAREDMNKYCENWKGKLSDTMSISLGVATNTEFPDLDVLEIAKIADKRMYEDKDAYYKRTGLDRRK